MAKRRKTTRRQPREERRFRVRGVRRDPPDMRKLGKALLSLAQAEAERQAQATHQTRQDADPETQPTPEETGDD